MDHAHIVTASQLELYSDTRESEAVIPELVYLLVTQSISNLSICRIPYGDSVNQPGFDGLVESEQAFFEFIPKGKSYWEIGTGDDPQRKATSEFTKRSKIPNDEKAESAFIFVTPRSWNPSKQTKWKTLRKGRGWREIRIIDSVKLADWLREFPAIGRWMLKKIGLSKNLSGLSTPAEHWEMIQAQARPRDGSSDPPLPPKIFIVGRDNACGALQSLFEGGSQTLFLFSESPQDVEDFVAAYLDSLEEEAKKSYCNRCLFINNEDVWRSLAATRKSHVFVAHPRLGLDSDFADLQTLATQRGHSVIIPICGAWSGESREIIKLWSPPRHELEKIFIESGYSQARARELAAAGDNRLSALRRHFLGLGSLPPYATWESARALAQAGLIGKWDGKNVADQAALENLLGKSYGEWIEKVRTDVLRPDTPLIQRNEKWRMVVRGEAWMTLGPRLTDNDLDKFQKTAIRVLIERDPKFDLAKEERYAASIHGKQLEYSGMIREGISETLALLGSRPDALSSCSQGKAVATATIVVRDLLGNAPWDRWASLEHHLPLLAEAAPEEFLEAVESALENIDKSPFHHIFAQEGSGIGEWNYLGGLLWALEALAWSPDYLSRVVLILADLASIDPGGNWANRPLNSLTDILLPWHLQTCASMDKRKSAVEALLKERPEVGWKLLLSLLPNNHGFTSGCYKPTWRNFISNDRKEKITNKDYWEQIVIYTELATRIAKSDITKLATLVSRLPDLPMAALTDVLKHLESESIIVLPDSKRVLLWEALDDLIRKHRKFSDAAWALPKNVVDKIADTASLLAPKNPAIRYRYLFGGRDFDLYASKDNDYDVQRERLNKLRQNAIQEILGNTTSVSIVMEFAHDVAEPYQVGVALGGVAKASMEDEILPGLLKSGDRTTKNFVNGFVFSKFSELGWAWVDEMLAKKWEVSQKAEFLTLLPFDEETWGRVELHLNGEENFYWKDVSVNPWGRRRNLTKAIEKLILYGRANAAIRCVDRSVDEEKTFDVDIAVRTLKSLLESGNLDEGFDGNAVVEVIKKLQKSPAVKKEDLFLIEWNFLPLLNRFSDSSPKTLEYHLASDPTFFCEIIGLVFRSKNQEKENKEEIAEHKRNLAKNGYKLLSEWKTPPGSNPDGSFDSTAFNNWLLEVKHIASESGHLDIALSQLGQVLPYAPRDTDGLWIHNEVASALNAKDAKTMRSGFVTELFNQRGVFSFTAGEDELKLARLNHDRAEALEAKGYTRFAATMREFARRYEQDAEREASREPFGD